MRGGAALAAVLASPAAAVRPGADRHAKAKQMQIPIGGGPDKPTIPCVDIAPTPDQRCKGEPPMGWNSLNAQKSAEECAYACKAHTAELQSCFTSGSEGCPPACEFAVYSVEDGACTSYDQCKEFKQVGSGMDNNGEHMGKTFKVCPMNPTPAPTVSDAAPAEPEVTGDPFTTHNGKRTQFYLPMGKDTPLIACGNTSLSGAPVGSGVPGDQQQWFRRFAVRAAGVEVLSVEARDVEGVAAAAQTAAALQRSPFDALTTLSIHAAGRPVTTTGTGVAGAVNYTVAQDVSRRLGSGFAETVTVAAGSFAAEFASAVSAKLAAGRNMHIDMRFTQVNPAECSGVLPEIWGTSPMSEATAKMLFPPQPEQQA